MLEEQLAHHSGIPTETIEYLLSLTPEEVYQDVVYRRLVSRLDVDELHRTLTVAREVYDEGLEAIKEKYNLSGTIMSGYTLCNWVLGFLKQPTEMADVLKYHASVPSSKIAASLPELLELLDEMRVGSAEWKKALVVFSLPMIATG
ncbi:MAG TPA: hypothetical protein ENI95_14480 [Chloroflexi bacterium]|nr:hypothetical protein [Chloroflexota bacterium]